MRTILPILLVWSLCGGALAEAATPPIFETLKGYDPSKTVKVDPSRFDVNVLRNGGFESGDQTWKLFGEGQVVTDVVRSGRKAYRLRNPRWPNRDARVGCTRAVPGGGAYEAAIYVKCPKGSQKVNIKFELFDPNGGYLGGHRSEFFDISDKEGWVRVAYPHKLPALRTVRVNILYRLWNPGPIYLDDATLKLVRQKPLYIAPSDGGVRLAQSPKLTAWTAPFPSRIRADVAVASVRRLPLSARPMSIRLAGNEAGTLPVFLSAADALDSVEVKVSGLARGGLGEGDFSLFTVEPLQYFGELYHDVLVPVKPFGLRKGESKMIWVNVHMSPGDGRRSAAGRLVVAARNAAPISVPFEVRAYGFDLPRSPSLPFTVGVPRVSPRPATDRIRQWQRDIARRRMSVRAVARPPLRFEGDKAVLDFAPMDRDVERLTGMGMNLFQLPYAYVVGGHETRFRQTFGPFGLNKISDEFRGKFVSAMRRLGEHLEKRGWLDKFNHNLWDEPYPKHYAQLKELAVLMKKAHRGYRPSSFVTAESIKGDLAGVIEEAISHADGLNPEIITLQKKRGNIVSVYNPYQVLAVTRRPGSVRGFMWWAYRVGVDRIYHWCIGPWRQSRGRTTMHRADYGHCWAFQNPGGKSFLSTVRFEMVREGLEDHDYLALLEDRMRAVRNRLKAHDFDPRETAALFAGLIAGLKPLDCSTDPRDYARMRGFLAEAITWVERGPLALFRASTTPDAKQITVETWAEPGATVTVNGTRVAATGGVRGSVTTAPDPRGAVRIAVEKGGRVKRLSVPVK